MKCVTGNLDPDEVELGANVRSSTHLRAGGKRASGMDAGGGVQKERDGENAAEAEAEGAGAGAGWFGAGREQGRTMKGGGRERYQYDVEVCGW